jgi:hypothetical protein
VSDPRGIQRRGLRDALRWLGGGSDGAFAWEAPGITAAVVPAVPERSIVNSVVFDDAGALEAAYEDLVGVYAAAGISAWDVWAPDYESGAVAFLESRGHAFDGQPAAMTLDLEAFEAPDPGDLDWDAEATFEELGRVNDIAYGYAPGAGMGAAMTRAAEDLRPTLYRARRDGETASVLAALEHDDDLGIYYVATVPGHGRQGLAGRLLGVALADAKRRGLSTSSLQSSAKGEPVYTRLGYVRHFRLNLYERRG